MKRRHRSYNYKFTGRTHSKKGIVGLLASLCSSGAAAGLILNSFFQGETASIYMAMGGFGAMIVAVVGFGLAVDGLRQEIHYRLFPALALVFSVLALLSWIGIYVLGVLAG